MVKVKTLDHFLIFFQSEAVHSFVLFAVLVITYFGKFLLRNQINIEVKNIPNIVVIFCTACSQDHLSFGPLLAYE